MTNEVPGGPQRTTPVIVIASVGRPEILHETLLSIGQQSEAFELILSVASMADVAPASLALPFVRVVVGPKGSSAQRNTGIQAIQHRPECVCFLDDDVEVDRDYLREMLSCYRHRPEVAVLNGTDLAAFRFPEGVTRTQARELVASSQAGSLRDEPSAGAIEPLNTSYGCLMSFRGDLLGRVAFDERLVLYGFLEDLDFALRCRPFGTIARSLRAIMVHMEASSGRVAQKRRGYSDIVNPFYVWSKHTGFGWHRALLGSVRRTWNNLKTALRLRDGSRLRGNLLGWWDVLRGRLRPERILAL